jgi:DNA-binding LacI/PurR family transcriptional regulator
MPSIVEKIVKSANVSRATAYRVLAGAEGVADETRNRVLEVISDLGEPSLRRRRNPSRRLAVWVPGLGQMLNRAHHRAAVQALEAAATERGLALEVINDRAPDDPEDAVAIIERLKVRGVVLISFYSVRLRRAIAERWQVGLFFEAGHDEAVTVFAPDDFAAGFLATRRLIEQGHTRIAVAVGGGRRPQGFSTRFAGGYARALAESGLPVDEGLILRHQANLRYVPGQPEPMPAGPAFLKLRPRPTALVGRGETLLGVMPTLSEAGLRIPDDVSVIGYGPEGENGVVQPKLTLIAYSARLMADAALDILSTSDRRPGTFTVPVYVAQGESVRALPGKKTKNT